MQIIQKCNNSQSNRHTQNTYRFLAKKSQHFESAALQNHARTWTFQLAHITRQKHVISNVRDDDRDRAAQFN